jgi:formylglycine-generating enzyme required for sulfatase activity
MALRALLLVLTGVGAVAGIGLVAMGMREPARPAVPEVMSASAIAVPAGSVTLDDAGVAVGAFELDSVEVSVAEYDRCVRAGACLLYTSASDPALTRNALIDRHLASSRCRGGRPDRAAEPMNCVSWNGAEAYCKWVGKRLPTRAEWWRGVGSHHPAEAQVLHRSATEKGFYAGEWTATPGGTRKQGPLPELRYVGKWRLLHEDPKRLYTTLEDWQPVDARSPEIGFRCAR